LCVSESEAAVDEEKKMNTHEKRILLALDRQVETNPAALRDEEIRLYRELIIRYVSETSCNMLEERAAPGARPFVALTAV